MKYYPLYADLENKNCIVIGGGEVAERKVESLLECQADVTVISPQLTERLDELAHSREIKYLRRTYRRGDLENASLVVGATDHAELNAIIYQEACQKNILVNIVDDPDKCSFIVPSVVDRGDLLISISTSGVCPALSKKIRKQLEEEFGEEYVDYLKLLGSARDKIKHKYESMEERKRSLNRVIDLDILPLLREGKRDLAEKKVEECI